MKQLHPLAGMKYRGTNAIVAKMKHGEPVTLEREPDNHHDSKAIKVMHQDGIHLGYLRMTPEQAALATAMDRKRTKTHPALFSVTADRWPEIEVETP